VAHDDLAAQFSLKAGSTRKFLYHPQLVELADLARAFLPGDDNHPSWRIGVTTISDATASEA
jgi:hypothetical protein